MGLTEKSYFEDDHVPHQNTFYTSNQDCNSHFGKITKTFSRSQLGSCKSGVFLSYNFIFLFRPKNMEYEHMNLFVLVQTQIENVSSPNAYHLFEIILKSYIMANRFF